MLEHSSGLAHQKERQREAQDQQVAGHDGDASEADGVEFAPGAIADGDGLIQRCRDLAPAQVLPEAFDSFDEDAGGVEIGFDRG